MSINRTVYDQLEGKLQSMNRKTFMYMGHLVQIVDWSYDSEMCKVETTRQIKLLPQREMLSELDNFLETDEQLPNEELERGLVESKLPEVLVPKLKSFEACDLFMDALVRAMDEVEHNPNFKEQAKVMTDIAGKAIDYAKVQVDAYKVASDLRRKN